MRDNKNSIMFDATKLTISKSITYIITLVTAMLLSRTLTLEEYGTYSQIMVAGALFAAVFSMGMPESSSFFLSRAEHRVERHNFLSTYYTLNTAACLFAGVAVYFLSPIVSNYFNNPMLTCFSYVMVAYPWMTIIVNSIDNVLVVYHQTFKLTILRVLFSLLQLLSIFITYIFHLSFREYMLLFVIANSICALSVYIIVNQLDGRLHIHIDKILIRKILKFCIPLGMATIVSTINIQLDKLLIAKYFNIEQLAIFTTAAQELPITIIPNALTAVLLPLMAKLLSKNKVQESLKVWSQVILFTYTILCFLVTIFITFAPQIITLLYSDKYIDSVSVFRVFCMISLLRITYFGMILNCIGKTTFILYSSIASLILNLALNYVCYFIWGFEGPAIATFLCVLTINVVQLVFTSKCIHVPFRQIFPWKFLLIVSLINGGMGLLFYAIFQFTQVSSLVLIIMWSVIYGIPSLKYMKRQWNALRIID